MNSPDYPDPKETAAAQAGMNQSTAVSQQLLNQTNQKTPTGSLTYSKNGMNTFVDADGKVNYVPSFTATTTLSPDQQKIFDTGEETQQNIANIGRDQSARIGSLLGTPLDLGSFDLNDNTVSNKLYDLAAQRLNPRLQADEEALRTRLANSGIKAGSDAFNREMAGLSTAKNDALNGLLLNGRQQAVSEMLSGRQQSVQEQLTTRNQPINEISALLSGSQVSQPNFVSTPQTSVGGVDYTGLVNGKYAADTAKQSAMLGGLFGLAGTAATAGIKYSDRRLKDNIRRVGALDNGLPVYSYRMKGSDMTEIGLMADEVEIVKPWAVHDQPSGFKAVDYARAVEA